MAKQWLVAWSLDLCRPLALRFGEIRSLANSGSLHILLPNATANLQEKGSSDTEAEAETACSFFHGPGKMQSPPEVDVFFSVFSWLNSF